MLREADYKRLFAFRTGLRRFLHWSETEAREHGLTAAQHQLLVAIAGGDDPRGPTVVADHLLLRHHSVVELVDRAAQAGLVVRSSDAADQRVVRLRLTAKAERKLAALSAATLAELARMRPDIEALWERLPARSR